jgi:hypothetical protein
MYANYSASYHGGALSRGVRMLEWKQVLQLAGVALLGFGAASASAGEGSGWEIRVTPYVWAESLDGDASIGNMAMDIDVGFGDLLSNLNFAISGGVEAQKGKWTLLATGLYADIEGGQTRSKTAGPFSIGRQTFGPFSAAISIDPEIKIALIEGAAAYRVAEWAGQGGSRGTALSLLGGVRWSYQKIDVDGAGLAGGGGGSGSASMKSDWFDPLVGALLTTGLSPKWDLFLRGDVGGFGVGSDITWNALALARYSWRPNKSFVLGYRALYQDYDDGSGANRYVWDATQHGPVVGMQFTF